MRFPSRINWNSRPCLPLLQFVALFFVVAGARLWLIHRFGSALPILDQWDAEGAAILAPWWHGTLRISDFFLPHNEHRLVLSRLLAFGLTALNGQWDARLELVVNAFFFAAIAVTIAIGLTKLFSAAFRPLIVVTVGFWGALPFAEENTLMALGSSYYFLLFFSLLAMWAFVLHPVNSRQWWLGIIPLCLACMSMASGFVAVLPVLVIVAVRYAQRRGSLQAVFGFGAVAAVAIFIGLHFRTVVPYHEALKAHTFAAWFGMTARCLGWPLCSSSWAPLVTFLPLSLLALRDGRGRAATTSVQRTEMLVCVAGWLILQAAAVAYSRAGGGELPIADRYMDVFGLATVLNVLAAASLMQSMLRKPFGVAVHGATIAWMVIMLVGAARLSFAAVAGQANRRPFLKEAEANISAYLATGDRRFVTGSPAPAVPYPAPARLATLLDDSGIRELLPVSVRLPLRVEMVGNEAGIFALNRLPPELHVEPFERVWSSYPARNADNAETTTAKIATRLPYLRFQFAGSLARGMALNLLDETRNKRVRVRPITGAPSVWHTAIVANPAPNIRIVARDANPDYWFAFREPRELGRWSYYASRIAAAGAGVFIAGVALWVALASTATFGHARSYLSPIGPAHES